MWIYTINFVDIHLKHALVIKILHNKPLQYVGLDFLIYSLGKYSYVRDSGTGVVPGQLNIILAIVP